MAKISRADVATRIGILRNQSGLVAANRSRATLSAFFAWTIGEGILLGSNPVTGTNVVEEKSRDRVLTDAELRVVWQQAGDDAYGVIVRLLALTGQRREEVASMTWSEVDLDRALWTISAERSKNGLPHEVPLSDAAMAILEALPGMASGCLTSQAGAARRRRSTVVWRRQVRS